MSDHRAPRFAVPEDLRVDGERVIAMKKRLVDAGVRTCFATFVDVYGIPKSKATPIESFEHMCEGSELYTVGAVEGQPLLHREPGGRHVEQPVPRGGHLALGGARRHRAATRPGRAAQRRPLQARHAEGGGRPRPPQDAPARDRGLRRGPHREGRVRRLLQGHLRRTIPCNTWGRARRCRGRRSAPRRSRTPAARRGAPRRTAGRGRRARTSPAKSVSPSPPHVTLLESTTRVPRAKSPPAGSGHPCRRSVASSAVRAPSRRRR